jgi:hypothetical protein
MATVHVGVIDGFVHIDHVCVLGEAFFSDVHLLFYPGSEGKTNTGVDHIDHVLQGNVDEEDSRIDMALRLRTKDLPALET